MESMTRSSYNLRAMNEYHQPLCACPQPVPSRPRLFPPQRQRRRLKSASYSDYRRLLRVRRQRQRWRWRRRPVAQVPSRASLVEAEAQCHVFHRRSRKALLAAALLRRRPSQPPMRRRRPPPSFPSRPASRQIRRLFCTSPRQRLLAVLSLPSLPPPSPLRRRTCSLRNRQRCPIRRCSRRSRRAVQQVLVALATPTTPRRVSGSKAGTSMLRGVRAPLRLRGQACSRVTRAQLPQAAPCALSRRLTSQHLERTPLSWRKPRPRLRFPKMLPQ